MIAFTQAFCAGHRAMLNVFRRLVCRGPTQAAAWASWSQFGGFQTEDVSTTTWLWTLHADAHDFTTQATLNGLVASRLFATHFGHLCIVTTWFSALCFAGSRFSNYLAWLAEPLTVKPSAQILYAGQYQVQDVVNMDLGAYSAGLQVTSGIFQVWRAWGMTSGEQLFALAIGTLLFGLLMLVAGWYHHHRAIPNAAWFNDVDAILSHHLTAVVGLGSIAWAGHLVHVAIPVDACLRLGMDPEGMGSDVLALLAAVPFGDVAGRILVLDWGCTDGLVSWLESCDWQPLAHRCGTSPPGSGHPGHPRGPHTITAYLNWVVTFYVLWHATAELSHATS